MRVEHAGVGGRVGPRAAPDRGLVDPDHLVDLVRAGDPGVPPGCLPGAVDLAGQRRVQDVVDQRRLARTGHPGDRGEGAQRERHVDVAQVVLPRADDHDLVAGLPRPPLRRHLDPPPPGQVRPGDRLRRALQLGDRPAEHDLATVAARRPGPMSTTQSAAPDRVLVVLDHDQRVAQVAQPGQRPDQLLVVPLVQPDRRFVQHVQHPGQARPDLGGQPDPLRLPAGQRRGRPVQRQITQAHIDQESQPRRGLLAGPGR